MGAAPRLALTAVTAVAGAVLAAPAAAAACEAGSGVTVVVDFGSLGGGTDTDCAAGDPATGLDALRGAGHEPTRAAQQPGYFVCRIDGKPANDPCQRASPEDAYWSYWHAEPGGTWRFSDTGAADHDPRPGSVEGWAFGAGDPPSGPPPARSAPAEQPSPTRAAQSPAAAPAPAAPTPPPTRRTAAATAVASPTAPASAGPSASPVPGATAAASSSSTPVPTAVPSPSASDGPTSVSSRQVDDEGSGSLAGVLLGLAVVLLLGAAAARQVQLRRARDEQA